MTLIHFKQNFVSRRFHPMHLVLLTTAAFLGLAATSLRADTIISVQFENNKGTNVAATNYSGVEPDAALADSQFSNSNVWNHPGAAENQAGPLSSSLVDSTGASNGAALNISHINGAFNEGSGTVPDTYIFELTTSVKTPTFTIDGLAPNSAFTLFLYAANGSFDRDEVFTVGSSSFDSFKGSPSSEDTAASTGTVTGVTSAAGAITGTWTAGPGNDSQLGEIDWAGFQLDVASPSTATPEPATLLPVAGALTLFLLFTPGRRRSNCRDGYRQSRNTNA